jgi:4-hydroxybenzoyl-CoA thioesterase
MSKPIEPATLAAGDHSGSAAVSVPFIHQIRVRWADCDPASIAYTGQIPRFALEAIEAWWERHVGLDWYALNLDRNIGTPFVHMTLDFRSPVTPRHLLECEVTLARMGNSSIAHRVKARQDSALCFEGEFVAVFVDADTMNLRSPPADILRSIMAHRGEA